MARGRIVTAILAGLLALAGCSSEESGPYLAMAGGGFIFNYRIAEATAGFVAGSLRTLPEGSTIEATFADPAGGPPIVLRKTVDAGSTAKDTRFEFVTPPLYGIKAGPAYAVTVRLLGADGKELQKIEKDFRSDLDQSILPEKPLTVGPGYTPNPEAQSSP